VNGVGLIFAFVSGVVLLVIVTLGIEKMQYVWYRPVVMVGAYDFVKSGSDTFFVSLMMEGGTTAQLQQSWTEYVNERVTTFVLTVAPPQLYVMVIE